jgi:predicted nucleic acid-binding protein
LIWSKKNKPNVDCLIAGDTDLHVLKEFGKTKIVTLSEFEAM